MKAWNGSYKTLVIDIFYIEGSRSTATDNCKEEITGHSLLNKLVATCLDRAMLAKAG